MNNDWRDYQKNSDDSLEHSWGTSPEQKAKERAYNHRYWVENRERILRQRYHGTNEYEPSGVRGQDTDAGTGNARAGAARGCELASQQAIKTYGMDLSTYNDENRAAAEQALRLKQQQETFMGQPVQRGRSVIEQQSSTPMSRVQSAVNAGKAAVANVLDQISDWASSAADSLRKK